MRPYEIATIFNVSLNEDEVKAFVDRITDMIKDKGGTTGQIDTWGRKQFAYEINHQTEGIYVFIEFSADPSLVAEVDRMLGLSDVVIRHRIVKQPENKTLQTAIKAKKTTAKAKS
ncbi:MAG: 30S ribosomal protein S6 [Firmicutes bacterium]|jgi:small subunit ribosomal protein S6|nr:30S ribosomal protein S6 [Bacillota bacterium]